MREKASTIYKDIPELAEVESRDGENKLRQVKSYVLRTNKLHTFQIEAVRKYYNHYGISYKKELLNYKEVFNNDNPVIIEIGFGMGTSTKRIAKDRNQYNYLGLEVFLNGFTKLLGDVGEEEIENIRLMRFDAVQVLTDMIEDNSIEGFHIFFPDPWPKKKHHKRRLIQVPFASLLTQKLKKGGYIYCATDWQDYADQMLEVFNQVEGLSNPYDGFAPSRSWRPQTKYEARGVNLDYKINEIWFEKN